MRRFLLPVIGVIVLTPSLKLRGDEAADLQAIVDKAIKAAGGVEVLEKFQKQKGKQEGTFYGMGEGMPFTATFASAAPNRFRMEVTGVFTIVLDGEKGWASTGGATQALNAEQLKDQQEEQHAAWIMSLLPLAKQRDLFKLTKVDGVAVEGRETEGLKVESEGHNEVTLFFDKETYDLVKAQYKVKSAELGNQEVLQEMIFKNFKDIDGARMSMEVLMLRDGKKYVESTMSDVEAVDEFPAETFSEP